MYSKVNTGSHLPRPVCEKREKNEFIIFPRSYCQVFLSTCLLSCLASTLPRLHLQLSILPQLRGPNLAAYREDCHDPVEKIWAKHEKKNKEKGKGEEKQDGPVMCYRPEEHSMWLVHKAFWGEQLKELTPHQPPGYARIWKPLKEASGVEILQNTT